MKIGESRVIIHDGWERRDWRYSGEAETVKLSDPEGAW